MRKKRLLSLALVAALSVTMLAGRGGKKSTESETNKDGSDKVKITLGIWPGEDLAENIPTFEGYQKTMQKLHPNVTCDPAPYTYATDTFVSLAQSGNCPTIFESWFTEPQKLIKQGLSQM